MKFFVRSKINLLLLGFVAAVVVGGSGSANADFIFGTPTNLGLPINSLYDDGWPNISADDLSVFFSSDRPGGSGHDDIWVAGRPNTSDPWGPHVNLGPNVNSSYYDKAPSVSVDGLTLYFSSNRPGGSGNDDLWVTTRETTDANWGTPVNLGTTVNSSDSDDGPSISADEMSLYFHSNRGGGLGYGDIWVTTRETTDANWGTPVNLGTTVNSSDWDVSPCISANGLSLFFASLRPAGWGSFDIWVAKRPTIEAPWSSAVNLGPAVNSEFWEADPDISADGRTLYFCDNESPRPGGLGGSDIWQVPITPQFDVNGDWVINVRDFCKLAIYWLQDESSVDIAPLPLGDSKVDFKDLKVLLEYWLKDFRIAFDPVPPDGADLVDPNIVLSWSPGETVDVHVIYFGDSFEGVNNADPYSPELRTVQSETSWDPCDTDPLQFEETYFWRIDEVDSGLATMYKGETWNFTTGSPPPPP
jgi:hypothetical protein